MEHLITLETEEPNNSPEKLRRKHRGDLRITEARQSLSFDQPRRGSGWRAMEKSPMNLLNCPGTASFQDRIPN